MNRKIKSYINAVLYWLLPQSGEIACLKAKVKAQEGLILTIRANRQTLINENAKLWDAIRSETECLSVKEGEETVKVL